MRKIFITVGCAFMLCTFAQATISCTFVTIQIDSNESIPLDVDGDGTNDYILQALYSPYVNNFIVGLNGNEIEVTAWSGPDANRCRRIESGDPVGALAWNDTAYMIENGQGAFSGGSEEYGHVGLRLNKGGNYHYAFIAVRAPYWQALVAVFAIGYNDEALAQTRTDACPQPVGIEDKALSEANLFVHGHQLHVLLPGGEDVQSKMQLLNVAGQTVFVNKLTQQENVFTLHDLPGGTYIAVILQDDKPVQRRKITLQ